MGITGLLPFITDPERGAIKTVSIREFKGQTAAIDGYVLLHRGAFSCARQLFEGKDTDAFVAHCMRYIDLLQKHGVRPVLVFDGAALSAKRETERQRRDARKTARKQAVELLTIGKTADAYQAMTRAIDVTHKMALRFIQAARKRGVDSIVAPYEADAQLAHLTRTGLAHFVITEDSDLIVFGCEKILFKLNLTGEGRFYDKSLLEGALCSKKLRCNNYSFEKFRIACILSGCDYTKSLPGIGLAKAWKFACITENLDDLDFKLPKMAQYLNLSGLDVTEEYIRQVKIANGAFKHQVVYDPVGRRRKPLEEFHENNASCVITTETVGQVEMNEDESFDRAIGNIDPMSGVQYDNYRPENFAMNSSSIWNRSRLSQPTLSATFIKTQPITSKLKSSINVAELNEEVITVSKQELESQDTNLTTLLQKYTKTDTKMSSTVKDCYYKELYEGQNTDGAEMKKDLDKEILARNPFIKKNQTTFEESPNILLENNKYNMDEEMVVEIEVAEDSKSDSVSKKSLASWLTLRSINNNKPQKTEKCPFKKQRNNKYDQLIVQKRKSGENGYFLNSNSKKSKLECTNENSPDSNLTSEMECDFSGKENNSVNESEIVVETTQSANILPLTNYSNNKSDILKEINSNMENDSIIAPENMKLDKLDDINMSNIDINLDNFPNKAIATKEIETLCNDDDNISEKSVESDELILMDQMLECVLENNDEDPDIEIFEQNSPIIKRFKKTNVVSSVRTTKALFSKGKKQTTLLNFLKKV